MRIAWLLITLSFGSLPGWTQSARPEDTLARMVVTIDHFYAERPSLTRDDVLLHQGEAETRVLNVTPLQGDRAGLELFLLVDNCSNCDPGSKFEELSKFIHSQASSTAVGIAYIQDGRLVVAQAPTLDRDQAVKLLSPPSESKPSNPFRALAELIRGWKQNSIRRAVLIVSNGIDPSSAGLDDPPAEAAIEAAQRAGVIIYAIYHPSADYASADSVKIYEGQAQLAHVACETGGEAYFLDSGPLPSMAPFLADIAGLLTHQYLLEFAPGAGQSRGVLEEVTVESRIHDVELIAARKAWIPEPTANGPRPPSAGQRQ